jgi:hypothetical protein
MTDQQALWNTDATELQQRNEQLRAELAEAQELAAHHKANARHSRHGEQALSAMLAEARAELADWMRAAAEVRGERDALAAKLDAVRELHQPRLDIFGKKVCVECSTQAINIPWPCAKARALGETGGTER